MPSREFFLLFESLFSFRADDSKHENVDMEAIFKSVLEDASRAITAENQGTPEQNVECTLSAPIDSPKHITQQMQWNAPVRQTVYVPHEQMDQAPVQETFKAPTMAMEQVPAQKQQQLNIGQQLSMQNQGMMQQNNLTTELDRYTSQYDVRTKRCIQYFILLD